MRFKKLIYLAIISFIIFPVATFASVGNNAKIRFLHHSTGGNLYSQGNVASWFTNYNANHGTNYTISEINYPTNGYPWNNYPYDWWNLWVTENPDGTPRTPACQNGNANMECLNNLTSQYDVIIFKHCFPGAHIQPDTGNPDVTSDVKTLENYKAQYRAIRKELDKYPNNLFIVWTLVPLHRLATDTEEASRAKQFVDWVKNNWLTEDGQSHPNIKIFDFWSQVAETNPNPPQGEVNTLKFNYERSHTANDSHPNTLANQTVGPIFAQSIVDDINEFQNQDSNDENNNGNTSNSNNQGGRVNIKKLEIKFNSKKKAKKLSKRKKIYSKKNKIKFKGIVEGLYQGKIEIYIDKKLKKIIELKEKERWGKKIKFKKNGTHWIRFKYINNQGKVVKKSRKYKIKIDAQKPKFKKMPSFLMKRKGDRVWWKATDNDKIKYYKYYFCGKKKITKKGSFIIPANISRGLHRLKIKAYDKAGNKTTKYVVIFVR